MNKLYCHCKKEAAYVSVEGQWKVICKDCLIDMGLMYCEGCEDWQEEVEYIESHDTWLCESCKGDL